MGDRANIVVLGDQDRAGKTAVFLYTHWSGYVLPEALKAGLEKGEERWNDAPYLARILFEEMIGGDTAGTTGFGISTTIGDNSYPLLVVDVPNQKVIEYPEREYTENGFANLAKYRGRPFATYNGKWSKLAGVE